MTYPKPDTRAFAYWIDSYDQIVCVSDNWLSFARANDAPGLTPESVLQRPIWEFLADYETREFYRILLERVRAYGLSVNLPFRCDSPAVIRFMEMRLSPTSDGLIQFDTRVLEQVDREPVDLFDDTLGRSGEFVTVCSWCKRVEVAAGRWQEVEEAVVTLDIFDLLPLPSLTHGVCDACRQMLESELARLSRRRKPAAMLQAA